MKRIVVTALLVMVALPMTLPAQNASAAAREFFAAHTKQDWAGMANIIDSAALRLVREKADEITEQIATRSAQMDAGDPSRAAAMRGMLDRLMASLVGVTFARTKTADDLKQLSDRDLMMRWLEAKSVRHQAGAMGDLLGGLSGLTGGAMPPDAQRGLDSAAALINTMSIDWQVVGEVAEGNSLTHVTYRAAGMTPAGPTGVLTFKLSGGRWRVQVNTLEDGDQLAVLAQLEALALQAKLK